MEQEFTEFRESDKSLKRELDSNPVSHMCLADTVVAFWSLTQEVAECQVQALLLSYQIFLLLNSANSVKTFKENSMSRDM